MRSNKVESIEQLAASRIAGMVGISPLAVIHDYARQ